MSADPPLRVILVVDDNDINRLVASRMIDALGYAAEVAADGETAITRVAAGGIDLVLMDVQMPGMNGFSATRAIRAQETPGGQRIPVLGLSAHALPEDRTEGQAAGMDDYLEKPLSLAGFKAALARWLPGRVG